MWFQNRRAKFRKQEKQLQKAALAPGMFQSAAAAAAAAAAAGRPLTAMYPSPAAAATVAAAAAAAASTAQRSIADSYWGTTTSYQMPRQMSAYPLGSSGNPYGNAFMSGYAGDSLSALVGLYYILLLSARNSVTLPLQRRISTRRA